MISNLTAFASAAVLVLTSVIATAAPAVQATLALGNNVAGIAVDPAIAKVFVTNQGSATVSVIDINTLKVVATIPVTANPKRIVSNAATHLVYVTHGTAAAVQGVVTVIDGTTNSVVTTIPVGNNPGGIAANFFIKEVYVTNNGSNTVSVISTASNSVIATIPVSGPPNAPTSNDILKKLYVNNNNNTISAIDETSHTVVKVIPVGNGAVGAAIDAQHAKAYVNNIGDKTVSVIDSTTDTVVKVIPAGQGAAGGGGATISPVYHRGYLPNSVDGTVTIINTDTDTVTHTVAVGATPVDAFVDANGGNVYILNQDGNTVSILNAATETVIDTLAVGPGPQRFVDGLNHIFVLNANGGAAGSVTIAAEENTLANTQIATEFYDAGFNHYFYTDAEVETRLLVDGIFGDAWHRTFQFFRVWTAPGPGRLPVCRLFSASFGQLSSHFYTMIPAECATRAANGWVLEDSAFFYLMPTDANGNCPGGTAPLFRVYNNGMGGAPNHRLTADIATRNVMVSLGWIAEGNGPLVIFACTPTLLNG